METQTTDSARDDDRPFSRKVSAIIGSAMCVTAIGVGLWMHYLGIRDSTAFIVLALILFLAQGLTALCLVDVLRMGRAMRMGALWALLRTVTGIVLIVLGAAGVGT